MANTYKVVQEVQSGVLSEYFGGFEIGTTGAASLWMGFEGEITITDVLLKQPGATVATYDLYLHYPNSGLSTRLNPSTLSAYDWSLNGERDEKGNMWYRLPTGASLEVRLTVTTAGPLWVAVLGK